MKTRHTVYNSIGLGIATVAFLSFLSHLLRLIISVHVSPFLGVEILIDLAIISCIGGGALLNILRHRFSTRPTAAMVVMYFLTCILAPLAIWGIVELQLERERRRGGTRHNGTAQPAELLAAPAIPLVYSAAKISWICAVSGFVTLIASVELHAKAITDIIVPSVAFAMILSLVLGIIALFGIRKFGPNRILIPALVGTIISGASILFFIAAIAVGIAKDTQEKHQHLEATKDLPIQSQR
jgi:hypothetical protein